MNPFKKLIQLGNNFKKEIKTLKGVLKDEYNKPNGQGKEKPDQ